MYVIVFLFIIIMNVAPANINCFNIHVFIIVMCSHGVLYNAKPSK